MLLRDHQKNALILPDSTLTYAQLLQAAHEYAAFIPEEAERVLICSENRVEWVFAFYAAWSKGCTIVPVDFQSTAEEIAFIAGDCQPQVCFCSKEREPILIAALAEQTSTPTTIVFETISPQGEANTTSIECPDPDATALLIYTSGTTGTPKGVMLSFTNLLANVEAVTVGTPVYRTSDRVLMLLPLHHIFPLLGTMVIPLQIGATVAVSPSLRAEDIIATLQTNKVTILIGVPRLYSLIMKSIQDKIAASTLATLLFRLAELARSPRLSRLLFGAVHRKFGGHLKFLVSGGAALDPVIGRQFTTLGFEILEGYGMTEAAPMITFTRPGQVRFRRHSHELHHHRYP